MSLKAQPIPPVPNETARVARAAFPHGNLYLRLRDELGVLYQDEDFQTLFPNRGQPGLAPWRLALVTVMQFAEGLSDRQAADAVRGRIDWKYALSLELTDSGFDFSVLSEFRSRLLAGNAEALLLDRMLERFRDQGLVKARGKQRTDSTHVLASIRTMNRLELVAETLRAALNQLAVADSVWMRRIAPPEWFERYAHRVEESRLPKSKAAREEYACTIGADGLCLLDALDEPTTPQALRSLAGVETLRRVWERHFVRSPEGDPPSGVRLRPERELARAAEALESPYDTDARFRSKHATRWTGYMVHLSESCGADEPHLITHVDTTAATVHEAMRTAAIHQGLAAKGLLPSEHLVDAGYVSADHLVTSRQRHGIDLIGPTRKDPSWQHRTPGAYRKEDFTIDWDQERVVCPTGKESVSWDTYHDARRGAYVRVRFSTRECQSCPVRAQCVRSAKQGRSLLLHPQAQQHALDAARARYMGEEGQHLYRLRAGVEGTISQGVRAFGLRQARYRGLAKAHLQGVATAAAINLARMDDWLSGQVPAKTRTSRFARLAA
jgi:transposase